MRKIALIAALILPLAACSQTERGAAVGAASGAVVGGVVTGNVEGAAVGAAIGGAAGALVGAVADQPGNCYYRDRRGRRYVDACP